ncbi:MAG: sulfate reduction electron transfer complex DsrMKJOP subunit DsrM [Planctomycetota bacterium]
MKIMPALIAILLLLLAVYAGVELMGLHLLFGGVLPYAAVLVFIGGFIYAILRWAKVPVPFSIPTTCGQQRSLSWIKPNRIDNPQTKTAVVVRMALEVLTFRSLFRNTETRVANGAVTHAATKWLWAASLAFHWCFLIVLFRHLRFFSEPIPAVVSGVAALDGFLQVGLPTVYVTGVILLLSVTFLFLRRIYLPQMRHMSLPADYFPLFLILGIVITGLLIRHIVRTDVSGVKEFALGLVSFHPVAAATAAEGIHWLFFVHLSFVSVLLIYFPFSKLMHMGGVFLSPTRNLPANSRAVRHINPWNHPVPVHSYEEYEEEFGDKMKAAGIPLDKAD